MPTIEEITKVMESYDDINKKMSKYFNSFVDSWVELLVKERLLGFSRSQQTFRYAGMVKAKNALFFQGNDNENYVEFWVPLAFIHNPEDFKANHMDELEEYKPWVSY